MLFEKFTAFNFWSTSWKQLMKMKTNNILISDIL